jgi:hypothetical protein
MDEQYEDPRYDSSQGTYVTIDNERGGEFVPLTLATPRGEYITTNYESGEGYFNEYTPEQRAAEAARIEADRQARLATASGILAENPLSVTGDQIQTRYGDRNVSMFYPLADAGQPVTGDTPAQLFDPQSNMPVFLSNPNDPFSYTYENTGTPAISGTVAQQAALYRPIENKGVFGTLGGDLLSAVKDPYFHKFAAAAAAMAGAAAFAPSLGANPLAGDIAGMIAADQAALGAGALGAGAPAVTAPVASTGLGATLKSIVGSPAFQVARLALPVAGALTGGSKLAQTGNQGGGQGFSGQGGGQGGGQGYTQGPWNTFMNPTLTRQEGSGTTVMQNPELAMLEPSLANQLAQSGAIPSNLAGSNVPSVNYYNYGTPPQTDFFGQSYDSPLMAAKGGSIKKPQKLAMGGLPTADVAEELDDQHIPEFITGATGHYVKGRGDGQSDDIPAMLADGEYVFDADTVAQLGNGSSDAGAKFLDSFRHAVREHKRSAPVDKIPPKASPLQYVKAAMKRTS